ncbi:late control protein D [Xenorhabdus indica]|nr:late control protein D [Xenorhabdus indica]
MSPPKLDWVTGQTQTPVYVLSAGDESVNARIQHRLVALTLTDNRGFEADQLDIELDDSDKLLSLPRRGMELSLYLGWQGERSFTRASLLSMKLNTVVRRIKSPYAPAVPIFGQPSISAVNFPIMRKRLGILSVLLRSVIICNLKLIKCWLTLC